MKHIFHIVLLVIFLSNTGTMSAQRTMSNDDRRVWSQRMRDLKHSYLIRELGLTREQQNEFFPLYDNMEDELNTLSAQARELEGKIQTSKDTPSDLEFTSAAKTLFEHKGKECEIELEYFTKFEKILSPRQLFLLKSVERNFMGEVVRRHGKMRNDPASGEHRGPRH